MRFDFVQRLANRGTMMVAALVVALLIALVYERSLFGALQYVTAFAFYLAVMVAAIPLPASLRSRHWSYPRASLFALLFAAAYAGNAIHVGRWQTVLLLTLGGTLVGLVVGSFAAARRPDPPLQQTG